MKALELAYGMKQDNIIDLEKIKGGSQIEFSRMLNFYTKDLFIFTLGILGNKENAEEVVNDVFLNIWENRKKIIDIKNLKGYLFIAVKNRALSALKSKKDIVNIDDLPTFYIDKIKAPADHSIPSDTMEVINLAIDKLPPKCKMVFSLSKLQGFKNHEIATMLEVTEKTVEYHLKTAVTKLCDALDHLRSSNKEDNLRILSILFSIP